MAMICETIYYDKDGNRSVDYYGNLHLGHDSANKIYLERMAKHGYARFQKVRGKTGQDVLDYVNLGRNQIKTPEENGTDNYTDESGRSMNRVTHMTGQLQNPFIAEDTAKLVAINNKAKDIIKTEYERFGIKKKDVPGISIAKIQELYPEAMEEAVEWSKEEVTAFERVVKKIMRLWESKEKGGTSVHKVLEDYIRFRKDPKFIDEDGDLDVESIKANALEGKSTLQYSKLLDQLEKFLRKVGKHTEIKFEEEVTIYDKELGIAGKIDLLAYDDFGNVYIFDYKSKERGKEWLFDMKGDNFMKGSASRLHDNKKVHGELQTTMYRILLERAGFNVVESVILYLEGDVVERGDEYEYENFELKKEINLNYHKNEVAKLIKEKSGFDINEDSTEIGLKIEDSLNLLAGEEGILDSVRDVEKSISRMLKNPLRDENGREYFNSYLGKTTKVYYTSSSTEVRKEQLKKYFEKESKVQEGVSDDLIDFFYSDKNYWGKGGSNRNNLMTMQAQNLLSGLNNEDYTLDKVRNIMGFEGISHNVLIAKHRVDGSSRIINISMGEANVYHNSSKQRAKDKNIFAEFITDAGLKYKHKKDGWEGTNENLRIMRAGMIGLELKRMGFVSSVESISNGVLTGSKNSEGFVSKPTFIGMNQVLDQLKIMGEVMTGKLDPTIEKNLKNKKLLNPKEYHTDYLGRLFKLIETDFKILRKVDLDSLKEDLNKYRNDEPAILKALIKTHKLVADNLSTSSMEKLVSSMEYRLLSQTILQLAHVHLEIGDISKELSWENRVRVTGRIADKAIKALDAQIKHTEQNINKEYKDYEFEHAKLIRNLMKQKKVTGVGTNNSVLFRNMYKVDPYNKLSDAEKSSKIDDIFVLKEEGSKEFGDLSKAEQEYIKFFNKMVLKGFKSVSTSKQFQNIESGETWKKGMIPLIDAGLNSKRNQEEDLKKKVKMTIDGMFTGNVKHVGTSIKAINTQMESRYIEQATSLAKQKNTNRMTMLGITDDGSGIPGYERVMETDLERVLNSFITDSLRTELYESTLGVYNSINLIAMIDHNEHFNKTDEVRAFADDFIKLKVFGEYKEESHAKYIDNPQKALSAIALGFSGGQVVMELATNLFASSSTLMQQYFLGENKRFGVAAYSKAGAMIMADQAKGYTSRDMERCEAIVREMGIYKSDSEAQARAEMQESRKNSWFQSKWMYHLNNMPFKFFKAQTFIAELIHLGIIDVRDASYTLGEDGKMKYNPAKDRRWVGIFSDTEGKKLKDIARPNGGYEANKNHAYYTKLKYESFLEEMLEEGSLDEQGRPIKPLTNKEIISMKEYSLSVYGSMDKDNRLVGEIAAVGRMLLKFKQWAAAKKDNYWTKTQKSEFIGNRKWVKDKGHPDGGYFEWEEQTIEGIIQTLNHLRIGVAEAFRGNLSDKSKLSQLKSVVGDMSPAQRANIARITMDILMTMILSVLLGALFDDDNFKKGPGKIVANAAMNSMSDINIFLMSDNLMKQSPLTLFSFLTRAIKNTHKTVAGAVTGDWERSSEGIEKLFQTSGLIKTVSSIGELAD